MTTHTDAPADDLASCKSRDPLPSGPLADALERIETDTMVDYGLRTIHGENVLAMAAARIRSLEAQRDEAVGLLRLFDQHLGEDEGLWTDESTITPEWIGSHGLRHSLTFGLFRQARAFLDSLKEGRHG